MSVDFDVEAACGACSVGFDFTEEKEESQSSHFHGAIFVPPYYPSSFLNKATVNFQSQEAQKADDVFSDKLEKNSVRVGDRSATDPNRNSERVILCDGNRAEVSYDRDDDGNQSLDVSVSSSRDTGSGTVEVEVYGGVSQDSDGNTSGSVGGSISIDF
jgi:hypothetical protein